MSTSNIFSNVFIYGNCTVQGTFTSLGGSAVSQWTTTGSSIYYNTGNIGIGTATPGQLLSLNNGNILLAGTWTAGTTYSLIGYNTDKRLEFNYSNGTVIYDNNAFLVRTGGSSGGIGNLGLYQNATGYVGIGTTNPGSLLTVSGGVGIGSGYNSFTAPTGGLIVQGNVGIGTSNPGLNALQVSGNVVTSGFTSNATNTVFNFDTLTVPFVNATQVFASTNVGIGTTNPSGPLQVSNATGSVGLFVSSTCQVGVGTNSQFGNGFGSGLLVNSGTINGSNAFNMVLLSNATTVNYTQVGQIGFGIGGDMPSFSIQSQAVNRDNGAGPYYDYGAQSDLRFIYKTYNTWPAGGVNEAMRIKGTNGYVGIGTTNPGALLDVQGASIRTHNPGTSTSTIEFKRSSDNWNPATIQQQYNTGNYGGDLAFQLHPADGVLGTAPATVMYLKAGGNVGIGTNSPGATLEVNGAATFGNPWWIITGSGGNATYTAGQVWGSSAVNGSYYGSSVNTGGGASSSQWNGSTGIFTFPQKGVYSITICMFINGTLGGRWAVLRVSSSVSGSSDQYMDFDPTNYGGNNQRNFKLDRYFNANDTFYCQTEGGSITLYWALIHTVYFINKIG